MQYQLRDIPAGEAGTDSTLKSIAVLVDKSLQSPYIRQLALTIIKNKAGRTPSKFKQCQAVYRYVIDNIAYINDPIGVETVQSPENTVSLGGGDCDDHSALNAALLMSIGFPVRFRVIGFDPAAFKHIFVEVYVLDRWLPFDTTVKKYLGFRAPAMPAEKVYNFKGEGHMTVNDLKATTGMSRGAMNRVVYNSVMRTLKSNWNNGLINLSDVESYVRVIDEGNSPARGTFAEPVMRQAIVDFKKTITKNGIVSAKPIGAVNGLEGLDGFLKSIWNGVKSAVGGVAKIVGKGVSILTGGGTPQVTVNPPTINIPQGAIQTQVTPEAASAAVSTGFSNMADIFKNPLVLGGLGVLAYVLLSRR